MQAQRPGDILVIESDVTLLNQRTQVLKKSGHNVVGCTTLNEGRIHLERIPYDVVLCGLETSDGNGCDLCRFIKETQELQQTSCGVFLGSSDSREMQRDLVDATYAQGKLPNCEADEFLPENISGAELVLRVRSMMRMRRYQEEIGQVISTLMATAEGAEEQNPHYKGHCKRLSTTAVELGSLLDCDEWELGVLEKAGYLHDIGLISIPGAIIEKSHPLSPREMQIIQQHCDLGEKLCRPVAALKPVLPVIRHHHERLNGSGYPDGLFGDEVPRLAQIFSIVDVYEGMRLWRPYRPAMTDVQAVKQLAAEVEEGMWNRLIFETFRDNVLPGIDARMESQHILWPKQAKAAIM